MGEKVCVYVLLKKKQKMKERGRATGEKRNLEENCVVGSCGVGGTREVGGMGF